MCFATNLAYVDLSDAGQPFSSLLIGMCFATSGGMSPIHALGSFSSLLIGMCFATRRYLSGRTLTNRTFSSLLIGMCFATDVFAGNTELSEILSVPFSSGCALRLADIGIGLGGSPGFQFPSHRDVLCDQYSRSVLVERWILFQFPSHRDVLCDTRRQLMLSETRLILSVPFSSGCALRQN